MRRSGTWLWGFTGVSHRLKWFEDRTLIFLCCIFRNVVHGNAIKHDLLIILKLSVIDWFSFCGTAARLVLVRWMGWKVRYEREPADDQSAYSSLAGSHSSRSTSVCWVFWGGRRGRGGGVFQREYLQFNFSFCCSAVQSFQNTSRYFSEFQPFTASVQHDVWCPWIPFFFWVLGLTASCVVLMPS